MSDDYLMQKEFKNLCRTCMSPNNSLTPLFSVLSLSNKDDSLNSILYKCTSIQVSETDVLPQGICNSCLEKLAVFYLFRELCHDTQKKLLQLYEAQKQSTNYIFLANNTSLDILSSLNPNNDNFFPKDNLITTAVKCGTECKGFIEEARNSLESLSKHNEIQSNLNESCDIGSFGCDKQDSKSDDDDNRNDINEQSFNCEICSKCFNSKYSLNRHLKTHTNPECLKCAICLKIFTRAWDVKRHMSIHTGEKPYCCTICNCSFTQSGTLSAHLQKHKEYKKPVKIKRDRSYLCSMCGKTFHHSSTLRIHLRRHVGDKPYECDVCKLCFVSSGRLQSHRRVHTGERPYACHICNKSFAHLSIMSSHLKAHADYKPHRCNYCSKCFSTLYYLNIHKRQHTGEKPFKCCTCKKQFACPKNLKQHEQIHLEKKPYLCIVCGKAFRRNHHLKSHLKSHDVSDILVEFFEVAVHNIIYIRKLYPESIFLPKKKYGVIVYQAIHPEVRDYIRNCLKAVSFHAKKKQLKRLFVCFERDNIILEKFVFDLLGISEQCESDVFLVELEQSLRNFILKLHSSQSYLNELSPDSTFSIQLQTTFFSNVEFNEDPVYEDFPWVEHTSPYSFEDVASIVPIHTVETDYLKLQMFIEKISTNNSCECENNFSDVDLTIETPLEISNVILKSLIIMSIMDGSERGVKTKTLAVFQNVTTKEQQRKRKKFRTHCFSDDDSSSPSDTELVIDEEEVKEEVTKKKQSGVRINFKKEILSIECKWLDCHRVFHDSENMYRHLVEHSHNMDGFDCKWQDCPNSTGISSQQTFIRHITYHGYLAKLINVGENVIERNNLPDCYLEPIYSIRISDDGYTCLWDDCNYHFNNNQEFFNHVECHANSAPTGKKSSFVGVIPCLWSGCGAKFSTRYKLSDHLKVHTKERMIACPQCIALFSSKTTFSDHRKRQLKSNMRSYQCSQCLKLFSSERTLSDHMRAHINQYKCTMCDMTCSTPSTLAKHFRFRHLNDRPFSCQKCSKKFVTISNLNTHLLTHENKPFQCDQCEFACKSKVGLSTHVEKVHGIEKPMYECQVCKMLFKRGDYLTKHLMKLHKFQWPSGHCRFRYRKDLDGVCRLQTVRYESLEVTEEMIKSESMKPTRSSNAVTYNVTYDENEANGFKLTVSEEENESKQIDEIKIEDSVVQDVENNEIIITFEDLDDKGNVINREEVRSNELLLSSKYKKEDTSSEITENNDTNTKEI